MTPKTPYAAKLVDAMREAGDEAKDLADAFEIDVRLVQKWRAGDTLPTYKNQLRIAQHYGKPHYWFFKEPREAVAS